MQGEDLLNSVIDVTAAQGFSSGPGIWPANPEFEIGTSVFDQYRALPRTHTFDLNAASLVDLCTIKGVDQPLAQRIRELGPYQSVDELRKVPGLTPGLMRRFADQVEYRQWLGF
ncbi:MAG TPA: helix-hairpin-helix domain-containing protein [Firmicutes bacterium]|nr:helix-hairpin-helix domain-containing protein [Candidatus Fermentithermobacillaceae bacterium]